jgi:dihydrofolate synthase/folylpolyglutamate synthase
VSGARGEREAREAERIRGIEARTVFAEWSRRSGSETRSLARAAALRDALGLGGAPATLPPILGVVGSKGKGTTTIHASAVLRAAGLRVGTLQSPGTVTNLDRYRIDGTRLGADEYVAAIERTAAVLQTLPAANDGYLSPTGFFTLTGIATFAAAGCEAIVAEAGLGGRSDELSLLPLTGLAMSEVFLEHAALLGGTIAAIATDKAGAAGPTTRFIDYLAQSAEAEGAIIERANAVGASPRRVALPTASERRWLPPGMNARNALLGATSAEDLLSAIGRPTLGQDAVERAIAAVRNPGRLSTHPTPTGAVLVDSAVSRDGLDMALAAAPAALGGEPERILVSIGVDKDLEGFIEALSPFAGRVTFVDLPGTHLHYPAREAWPYGWAPAAELPALLEGRVLAVGTVSFSSLVLEALGVDTGTLF